MRYQLRTFNDFADTVHQSQTTKAKKNLWGNKLYMGCVGCCSSVKLENYWVRNIFFVFLALVLICTWIALAVLFSLTLGSADFILNEHYSAKTIHLHKVTKNAQVPIEWNSLGAVTPYVEPQLGDRQWTPTAYFPFQPQNYNEGDYKGLDNPADYTMYINSERTLAILSSICPLIYLLTLIVVSSISLAYFFAALYEEYTDQTKSQCWSCLKKPESVRDLWCNATIFVYAIGLFFIFGGGALVKRDKWLDVDIEYMISNQIPSVLYNIFVLAMYCLYLKRKDSYWKFFFQQNNEQTSTPPTEEGQPLYPPQPDVFLPQPEYAGPNPGQNSRFAASQIQSMYKSQAAWQMPIHIPKQQELLMNSSAFVQQHTDTKKHGPVSNEFNVIVCIILLLAGIANLAMVKAYFLETEAQLVILSLVMFCVLEIGRSHLVSYFWYSSVHAETTKDAIKHERFAIVFIDFVVFLLQLFIVFIWQYTMDDVMTVTDSIVTNTRGILLFVVTCLLITRLISVLQGIAEIFGCCCVFDEKIEGNEVKRLTKENKMLLVWVELFMYLIIMLVFVIFAFVQSMPKVGYENFEKNLIVQEQLIYQNTKEVTNKADCAAGIAQITLMSEERALCTLDAHDVYKLSPVTMKVFAWTRFYILQQQLAAGTASADVLFCSNGFEQHWGKCKDLFSNEKRFSSGWSTKVKTSAGLPNN